MLPTLLGGRLIGDEMRRIFSLPTRMGGLGVSIPSQEAELEYVNSMDFTQQLSSAIFNQAKEHIEDKGRLSQIIVDIRKRKEAFHQKILKDMNLPDTLSKTLSLSAEKGASIWLTSLPLKQFGFRLNKQQFEDALCMR